MTTDQKEKITIARQCYENAARELSRAALALQQTGGAFSGTVHETKETIGDMLMASQALTDALSA